MRRDDPFGDVVTPGYKIQPVGEVVTPRYKIRLTDEVVSGGHKNSAGGESEKTVSTGHKNAAGGESAKTVSGGHKTVAGLGAFSVAASFMDALAATTWIVFPATACDGIAFTVAGARAFPVAGCFERLLSGIRCAGCDYVVMNLFFACRDGFIFSRFVISFLPLKEPLRARGIFLCWRFYEC